MTDAPVMTTSGRRRWIGLVGITLGVAMIIVDATILNVAIPSIIDDLGIDLATAQWANTIYSLVFASLLISFGRLGDAIGRRRLFIAGVTLFVLASIVAGAAGSGTALLLARFAQGLGGAIILPSTLSMVNALFRGRERAIAFGIWGATIGGVVALGPLLGGWFTTHESWRWAFWVNVPVGLLAIAVVLTCVPETSDPEHTSGPDIPGTLLLSLGLASVVFACIEGRRYGWWHVAERAHVGGWTWPASWSLSLTPVAAALGIVLLAAFAFLEPRRARAGKPVLVDFALFSLPSFRYGNIAAAVVSLGELGIIFVVPLYLQAVLGFSAFDSGVELLALSLGAFVAGGAAAPLTQRVGARLVVQVGMGLEVVGILAFTGLAGTDTSGWALAAPLFAYGVGVGFATAQLTSLILAEVPIRQSGQASGISSTSRQVGSALGIAIVGTVFATSLSSSISDGLRGVPELPPSARAAMVDEASRTGSVPTQSGGQAPTPAVTRVFDDAFVDGLRHAGWVAAGFVALGFVASLRLPREAVAEPDGS